MESKFLKNKQIKWINKTEIHRYREEADGCQRGMCGGMRIKNNELKTNN